MVGKCALDLELRPDSSCLAKIHAGPGMVKAKQPGAPADQEIKFILDLDLSMGGKIAMVLARGTKLSIFDEPEAGIDLWSFENLIRVFQKMYAQTRGNILIISHQERILEIADKIAYVKDGRLEQYGSREEILPALLGSAAASPAGCKVLTDKMEV